MTLAFCALLTFCALNIAGAAWVCSGRAETPPTGAGTLFSALIFGVLEVTAAFYMASATGSLLVLVAAWVTLVFNIIGVVLTGVNYGKVYNPYLWYMWLMIALNAALVLLYVHAYLAAI